MVMFNSWYLNQQTKKNPHTQKKNHEFIDVKTAIIIIISSDGICVSYQGWQ